MKRLLEIGHKLWITRKEHFNKYQTELNDIVNEFKDADFTFSGEMVSKIPTSEKEYIEVLNKRQNKRYILKSNNLWTAYG